MCHILNIGCFGFATKKPHQKSMGFCFTFHFSLYFWSMQGKAAIWKFLTLSFCGGDSLCLRNLPWW